MQTSGRKSCDNDHRFTQKVKHTLNILLRGMSDVDWILYFWKIPVFAIKMNVNPITQKNFPVSMGSLKTISSNILSLVNFSPGTEKLGKVYAVES